jgi:O-antigen/teichoic acid export membrane protein
MASDSSMHATQRRANIRTALVLASMAIAFFIGILATRYIGDGQNGITVLGAAVMFFLVVAIGRNLRK